MCMTRIYAAIKHNDATRYYILPNLGCVPLARLHVLPRNKNQRRLDGGGNARFNLGWQKGAIRLNLLNVLLLYARGESFYFYAELEWNFVIF